MTDIPLRLQSFMLGLKDSRQREILQSIIGELVVQEERHREAEAIIREIVAIGPDGSTRELAERIEAFADREL